NMPAYFAVPESIHGGPDTVRTVSVGDPASAENSSSETSVSARFGSRGPSFSASSAASGSTRQTVHGPPDDAWNVTSHVWALSRSSEPSMRKSIGSGGSHSGGLSTCSHSPDSRDATFSMSAGFAARFTVTVGYRASSYVPKCSCQPAWSRSCTSYCTLTSSVFSYRPMPAGGSCTDIGPVSRTARYSDPFVRFAVTSFASRWSSSTGSNGALTCP